VELATCADLTSTASSRRDLATSERATTTAAAPSETAQQSNRRSGEAISGAGEIHDVGLAGVAEGEGAYQAEVEHPTESQLETFASKLQTDSDWTKLLPGLAKLALEHDEGVTYSVRIVKKGDVPGVKLVKPGEPGAEDAVSILRYNELDRYPFYLKDLQEKASVNQYEARALVHLLGIKTDDEGYKLFRMGKQDHARYSHQALKAIRDAKAAGRLPEAKQAYSEHLRTKREAAS